MSDGTDVFEPHIELKLDAGRGEEYFGVGRNSLDAALDFLCDPLRPLVLRGLEFGSRLAFVMDWLETPQARVGALLLYQGLSKMGGLKDPYVDKDGKVYMAFIAAIPGVRGVE